MKTSLALCPSAALLWCCVLHAQTTPAGAPVEPTQAFDGAPAAQWIDAAAPSTSIAQAVPARPGPDNLPSLEAPPEAAPPAPPPSPNGAVPTPAIKSPPRAFRPVRAERRIALLGEIGWNGLAGFGPMLTFHVLPEWSLDLGAGLALVGWKVGLRTRYNFLRSSVTPFIGAGVLGASGFDTPSQNMFGRNDNEVNVKIHASAFLQTVAGVDWTSPEGFTLVGALGYAFLLSGDNVEVITGEPTADQQHALDAFFRSSIVLSLALGYSFR